MFALILMNDFRFSKKQCVIIGWSVSYSGGILDASGKFYLKKNCLSDDGGKNSASGD
jgi:hypothetical protein